MYLPRDYYTRKPRGFGFVEFMSEKDARRALDEMDGADLYGSYIKVAYAREERKSSNEMKRRANFKKQEYRSRSRSPRRRRKYSRSSSYKKSMSKSKSPQRFKNMN